MFVAELARPTHLSRRCDASNGTASDGPLSRRTASATVLRSRANEICEGARMFQAQRRDPFAQAHTTGALRPARRSRRFKSVARALLVTPQGLPKQIHAFLRVKIGVSVDRSASRASRSSNIHVRDRDVSITRIQFAQVPFGSRRKTFFSGDQTQRESPIEQPRPPSDSALPR